MKISIIIPCYNELASVERVVHAVLEVPLDIFEIIVVDDGSSDGTGDLLRGLATDGPVKVLRHPHNLGKGAALRTGIAAATGDVVVIQDADMEYDPRDLPALIQPIEEGRADVVYGSRFIGGRPHRTLYFWHRVANAGLTTLSNLFTGLNLTDMETGYKAFRCEIVQQIDICEDRFGFEPEVTAKIARLGCRVYEVGVSYYGRTYEDGKKIGFSDGLRALWCILKYSLTK
jgi:glycosyltransferase involved in cell wall biosynthesis